jgi:BirA family biotin operon repressor/biotin-[acetyl-CoA-carboxylase] ligase
LEKVYDELNSNQTKKIIADWTKMSSTIGKKIEITTSDGIVKGEAIKLDHDGGLIIKQKENIKKVIAGDVIHLSK